MADKYDFGGYATKYETPCTDGRTIKSGAFKHMDGMQIPLVWAHGHKEVENVLGHAVLEARPDGIYAYGYFNDSDGGVAAKKAVMHKDIAALSIYANKLVERSKLVHSGQIKELSLVLSGANPGAFIDNVTVIHADGEDIELEDEVIISPMLALDLTKEPVKEIAHEDSSEDGETVGDVLKTMNEKQRNVTYALVAKAMEGDGSSEVSQSDEEGENFMKENVFNKSKKGDEGITLSHSDQEEFAQKVFDDLASKKYGSFRDAFLAHAGTYGIDNISFLFPDAKALDTEPTFDTRRMGWVAAWMSQTRHTPFSRIKKLWADLTAETARAKGYVTGAQKVEQVFPILKRTTAPTTVYKKQKLDKDDISDITDFNVVTWMWREMRFMLDEEVARAGLVGDSRVFGVDPDAINPSCVRPIFGDDPLFVHYLTLPAATTDWLDIMDAINTARVNYKGNGTPNFYTTNAVLTGMLLYRDTTNRRMFRTLADVAAELRVAEIIEVEVMEGLTRSSGAPATTRDLLGIMVNPHDYTYGADKGGQVSTYDQFDIDVNQEKYLIETRVSGSLLDPRSAMVVERQQV